MVAIKGLQKTTLVDFPPYVSCTVFISTCNFRCGFCHNPELVNDSFELDKISEKDVLDFLDSRKKVLDGVCITGGEPTLYPNLKGFISKIKEKGFKVKLDTNGMKPSILKELIDEKILDYIAMDIKNSLEKYDLAAGVKVDISRIEESIDLIRNSNVDYEFRTTVVRGMHAKEDIEKIGQMLNGSKKFAIQNFKSAEELIDPGYKKIKLFSDKELEEFKSILGKYFGEVEVRA
ncbi:MAG: anaerobic ribonucleoside-triphosphate reductase activating protein [Nanoarchaeota archaeon]|nr:anaerobic ribonucleoside-triphosphate reductase activating protein [Nanoarchaeota archaeon]